MIHDIESWFAEGLEVRNSDIHGLGLFAQREFHRGAVILRFGGCLFHLSERYSSGVMPSTTTPLTETVMLAEPSCGQKDYSDYLNHSCDPNLGFRDALSIMAIRDIRASEEMVIDYAFWEADPEWKLKTSCNCNKPRCRTKISGRDWQAINPTDDYFQFFSPFLRRRILKINQRGD